MPVLWYALSRDGHLLGEIEAENKVSAFSLLSVLYPATEFVQSRASYRESIRERNARERNARLRLVDGDEDTDDCA